MKRKFSMLAFKFLCLIIAVGVLICSVSAVVGYRQYKSHIEKQYNDTAYQFAELARSYMSDEVILKYADVIAKINSGEMTQEQANEVYASEEYQNIRKSLVTLREKAGANDIFVVVTDLDVLKSFDGNTENWLPLNYVFDCYAKEEESFPLGGKSPMNPSYIEETVNIHNTGKRSSNYFISESQFGYNTSAMLPVVIDGEVVVSIGVEIPMSTIETALSQYVKNAVLVTAAIVVLFLAVYMILVYKQVINPINLIATEAENFVKNKVEVSGNLEKIKTKDEIQNLAGSILQMQRDINDYIDNLTAVTAEKERIGAELDVATHIQSSMLPCIFPAFPERNDVDIFATMTPAKEVGGDFYDFFMVDEKHLALVMADVSGKGVPAALFMVIGKTLVKDHTYAENELGEVFTTVNNLLCESNSEGLFITAFECVIDLETGEMTYVNAGHEPPYICRKGQNFEKQTVRPGLVLAGIEDMKYRSGTLQLKEGDKIFLYTDGVTEATDKDNKLYGFERLEKALNRFSDLKPEELLHAIKNDVDEFVGAAPQFDDITMLGFEYLSKENKDE